jgi:hypothetical protein
LASCVCGHQFDYLDRGCGHVYPGFDQQFQLW